MEIGKNSLFQELGMQFSNTINRMAAYNGQVSHSYFAFTENWADWNDLIPIRRNRQPGLPSRVAREAVHKRAGLAAKPPRRLDHADISAEPGLDAAGARFLDEYDEARASLRSRNSTPPHPGSPVRRFAPPADPDVLRRLRSVDGLRGVLAVAHQGGVRPVG